MYEERHEGMSVKTIILQILIVILFVFLLMWLFPLKNTNNTAGNNTNNNNNGGISIITDRVFSENVNLMKEAAKDYFTNARLPKNVGDKVNITLGQMLEKKIILPFADKDGKQCDSTASYVEIVKLDDEYEMKINLKCSTQEDYVIVKMGCYDYCDTDVCEDKTEKIIKYQYKCPISGSWSAWSEWSKTVVTQTSTKQVETKVVKETVTTQQQHSEVVQTGTKKVFDHYKETQYWDTFVNTSPAGASCTSKVRPVCDTCYKYEVVYTCLLTKKEPVYRYEPIKETVIKTVNVDTQVDVTYYRYRTYTSGSYYFTWSTIKNNTTLIKKGCALTGKIDTKIVPVSK